MTRRRRRCSYYAPGARTARPRRPTRRVGMRHFAPPQRKHKHHVEAELQYDVYAHPATTTSAAAASGETVVSGTGSGSVYRAQILAASAPQLYVRRADKELEHLRALAMARARPCGCQCLCLWPRVAGACDSTPGHRRGIRPLLLPQKLRLLGSSGPQRETGKV
jgi:hypothetical protein